ncbi:MAG: hypothetical protein RLY31_2533 [Bacteroidota bacterium]
MEFFEVMRLLVAVFFLYHPFGLSDTIAVDDLLELVSTELIDGLEQVFSVGTHHACQYVLIHVGMGVALTLFDGAYHLVIQLKQGFLCRCPRMADRLLGTMLLV